ncbi:Rho termination factor N-terminal domain-containing protein [Marinobacterium sp. AK62]|uniref:Rho termination factor N-terminal domain-containing protein n=2 Tax=Marinobacterium alkalitolerans TaxID=1542925 RepID=A0ABS3Z7S8_9GAMM|nr:Rho termination factor N-terminal domain-containing protein [Marinobacterium alkalitolerans]
MSMAKKTDLIVLELTSAIVMEGEIVTAGNLIEVTEKEARNLLARGKAVVADEQDVESAADADLTEMTVADLQKLAGDIGVEGFKSMKKDELIAAIEAASEASE